MISLSFVRHKLSKSPIGRVLPKMPKRKPFDSSSVVTKTLSNGCLVTKTNIIATTVDNTVNASSTLIKLPPLSRSFKNKAFPQRKSLLDYKKALKDCPVSIDTASALLDGYVYSGETKSQENDIIVDGSKEIPLKIRTLLQTLRGHDPFTFTTKTLARVSGIPMPLVGKIAPAPETKTSHDMQLVSVDWNKRSVNSKKTILKRIASKCQQIL